MRTEQEISSELARELALYRENARDWTAGRIADHNRRRHALQQELSAALSIGAKPCPNCGHPPMGMNRTPSEPFTSIYEVGCTLCRPRDGVSYSAQGKTPEEAVDHWNAQKFIKVRGELLRGRPQLRLVSLQPAKKRWIDRFLDWLG